MIAWDRVVCNLRGAGMSLKDIGVAVGLSDTRISALTTGTAKYGPYLPSAIALLDLHYDICEEKHTPELIGVPW